MIRVAHLSDDAALGGVSKVVEFLLAHLGGGFEQRLVSVQPTRMTPLAIDADVIVMHASSSWAKLAYLALLRMADPRRPLILVEHTYTASFMRRHVTSPARFRALLRTAYGLATRVVTVSDAQAAWLIAERLVAPDKLHVIKAASDVAPMFAVAPPAPHAGPLVVGAYGRYSGEKGFDVLIEAFRSVPPDVARLVIGGLGPEKARLMAAARDLPHVVIGDVVRDVAGFLAGVDAVAIPSRREAFGQVALEARAAARPVIATAVDGLVEQLSPAYGTLVPPDDPAALATAIRALAGRDLAAMGRAARRSAEGHAPAVAAGWRDLLSTVVESRAELVPQSAAT